MNHGKLIAGACALAVAAGGTGAAMAATGAAPSKATIKVSQTLKIKPNRYVQDGLRWDKDVYRVALAAGPCTSSTRWRARARTRSRSSPRRTCRGRPPRRSTARCATSSPRPTAPTRTATRRRSSRSSRTGSARATPSNVDQPGDSGVTGPGKKGESIDLKVTAKNGHDALLHVPDPPVDGGPGRASADRPLDVRRSAGTLAVPGSSRSLWPARRGRAHPGRLGGRGPRVLERGPERARRDHGHHRRSRGRDLPDRRLPPVQPWVAPAVPNAARVERRRAADPRARCSHARVGDRLRIHFKNMDSLRHDDALDALPRRAVPAQLRRRVPAGRLGP